MNQRDLLPFGVVLMVGGVALIVLMLFTGDMDRMHRVVTGLMVATGAVIVSFSLARHDYDNWRSRRREHDDDAND